MKIPSVLALTVLTLANASLSPIPQSKKYDHPQSAEEKQFGPYTGCHGKTPNPSHNHQPRINEKTLYQPRPEKPQAAYSGEEEERRDMERREAIRSSWTRDLGEPRAQRPLRRHVNLATQNQSAEERL